MLDAIRSGRVDALVVPGPEGEQIYTLAGADQSYRIMIETMNEGAIVLSEDGIILYCNRRLADMLRMPIENVIGGSLADLAVPEDEKALEDLMRRAFREEGIKAEMRLSTGRGDLIPVLVSLRHFSSEEKLDAVCMVVTDLTELKKTETRLKDYAEELTGKNSELRLRAAQLSRLSSELTMAEHRERRRLAKILHDHLQQLLVGARFSLETLEGRVPGEYWRIIENAANLMQESLDVSRTLTVELSPPVLYEGGLLRALQWLVRWMNEKHGLTVNLIDKDGCGDSMRQDIKTLLFSSVRELLLNVVKHADVLSAEIELACPDHAHIRITVVDHGAGFDPDRCADEPDEMASGFGLFSIRERLQFMGGKCRIDSSPGRGTTVCLLAPIHEESVKAHPKKKMPADTETRPSSAGADREKSGAGIRVMLVDDHSVMRQGLSLLLSDYPDIDVVGEASDGEDAIIMARELCPDLILMDISMPKMNGIEATRIIHAENPDIKIIGLSMFDAADQAEAIRQVGAAAYLKKSGNRNELLQTIRSVVSG